MRRLLALAVVLAMVMTAATVASAAPRSDAEAEASGGIQSDEVRQDVFSDRGSRRGRAVLRRAVRAIGGRRALSGLEQLEITATGATWLGYEAQQPGGLVETSTYARTYTFDLAGQRLRVDTERQLLVNAFQFLPPHAFSRVLDGNVGGVTANAGPIVPAGNLPSEVVAGLRRQQLLFNPHLLLRQALEQPDLVGYGGRARVNRRPHRILTIDDEGGEIRLFIDQRSGRISKLETTENHPLVRDTAIEVRYHDWQRSKQQPITDHRGHGRSHRLGSLRFPTRVELYAGGALLWEETRQAVEVEPSLGDDHFDLPPEADPSAPVDTDALAYGRQSHHLVEGFFAAGFYLPPRPGLAPPVELAPGVTLLASGANTVAVSHDGGLIVLEAPNTPTHGTDIVDALSQLAPGQPITHVVPSHHHLDHASAVRSLVAAGATVVVADGVGDFWEDVLSAESTVRPDALSQSGVTGQVEKLDPNSSIVLADDDGLSVTVHHVPANPHADDMVIATIETGGEIFVYEADLYNAGFGFTLVIGGPESLFAALRDLDIINESCQSAVPLTIVPAHGVAQTLEASLAELADLDLGCQPIP